MYQFPTHLRLRTQQEFRQVFKLARPFKTKCFGLKVAPNGLDYPRLGMVIRKRYIHDAFDRNTIKRITRETFRHQQAELKGFDIILLAYDHAAGLSKTEIHQQLKQLWTQLITPSVSSAKA